MAATSSLDRWQRGGEPVGAVADPKPSNQFKQTPGRALLAFAIAACLVAVYTVVDAGRRAQQEEVDQPTALGDPGGFEFGPYDTQIPVLHFGGEPLYRQWREPRYRADAHMLRVGRDDADQCTLYRFARNRSGEGAGERSAEGFYYVKLANGDYIEVAKTPKQPSA